MLSAISHHDRGTDNRLAPVAARAAVVTLTSLYLAAAVIEGWFILASSANVPFSDTWNFAYEIAHFARSGGFPWRSIFAPYGQGRPALEQIVILFAARYFHFNVQLIKLFCVPIGILETACVIWAVRFSLPRVRAFVVLLVALPIPLLVFGFANWQNLLQEWNVMNLAAVALVFLSIVLATTVRSSSGRRSWWYLIGAFAVCIAASFTGESGALAWICCLLVIWVPFRKFCLRQSLVFSAGCIVFLSLYLRGIPSVNMHYPLTHLAQVLRFAAMFVGNGVIFGTAGLPTTSLVIGACELVLAGVLVALVIRHSMLDRPATQFALALMLFTFLASFSTAFARLRYGLSTADASRYVVIAAPMAIGIYLLMVDFVAWDMSRPRRVKPQAVGIGICAAAALCLIATSFVSDANQYQIHELRKAEYSVLQRAACDPLRYPDSVLSIFNNPTGFDQEQRRVLLSEMSALRGARLSVYEGLRCAVYDQHAP